MTWYAAFTLARAEAIAEHHLREVGYATLYLHYAATIRHARRSGAVLRPYFPRYVFVEAGANQGLYGAAKACGVSEMVGFGGSAIEIPARVMAELHRRADHTGRLPEDDPQVAHLHRAGSTVRIVAGAFEGFLATVRVDSGREVRLWIEIFGRLTEAKIPSGDVETASPGCAAHSRPPIEKPQRSAR